MEFSLDGYSQPGSLLIQPGAGPFDARLKLADSQQRPLHLTARVSSDCGGALVITIHASFWLVNRTGLPLVFKQEGEKEEASGQFEEHELARMIVPLLFYFPDSDTASPSIVARVGSALHPESKPAWCKHFYAKAGNSTVRRLRVAPPYTDKRRPEWVYIVGIDSRQGRGRYRLTTIVTISPRLQLYNQSPHRIQFAQLCFVQSAAGGGGGGEASAGFDSDIHLPEVETEMNYLTAHPRSSLAFHWPRVDMEQLICLRLLDVPGCLWSGGFSIEQVSSFQLSVRDRAGRFRFLRVEISLVSSTFCIVLSAADNFPPPFRIDNFSEVPLTFHQTGVTDQSLRAVVKPHQTLPYALDVPILPAHLSVVAPGSASSATYNMNVEGEGSELTYENFIYLAFTATFQAAKGRGGVDEELVLDVPEGSRVVLGKKSAAKRSQLWRMTSTGLLQHEGSSPPQDPRKPVPQSHILVLDIAGPAVQPDDFVPLMLRRADTRRSLTQQWRFTEDGRLCCQHSGLYVQARDGHLGLRMGQDAVLGPEAGLGLRRTEAAVPVEQSLSRQRLRPGSGFLGVRVATDGPTRVLQITDLRQGSRGFARAEEPDWLGSRRPWPVLPEGNSRGRYRRPVFQEGASGGGGPASRINSNSGHDELQLLLGLKGGLGISLVSNRDVVGEELLYISLTNILLEYQSLPLGQLLDGSVQTVQVDAQTPDAQMPVVLYLSPTTKSDDGRHLPAIHFGISRTPPSAITAGAPNTTAATGGSNAEIFRHFILTVKNLTVNIEEELVYKLDKFGRHAAATEEEQEKEEEAEEELGSRLELELARMAAASQLTRYYAGTLRLTLSQVRLSVLPTPKLRPDLVEVKRRLGLSLVAFSDAAIDLGKEGIYTL